MKAGGNAATRAVRASVRRVPFASPPNTNWAGGFAGGARWTGQQQRRWAGGAAETDDYYGLLGVSRGASIEQIKKAYKKKAFELHPDRNTEKSAGDKFAAVNEAYEVLSDENKRTLYDRFGKAGLQEQGFQPSQAEDIFESLFGMGMGRRRGPQRSADKHIQVQVPLKTMYLGGEHELRLDRQVLCDAAKRAGSCRTCGGSGQQTVIHQMGNMIQQQVVPCQTCGGTGTVIPHRERCPGCSCGGGGVMRKLDTVVVDVEPGAFSGQSFVLQGKSDEAPGVTAGDVYIELVQKKNNNITRSGDDLIVEQKIELKDALAGCTLFVPLPNDDCVELTLQPGEISPPNGFVCIPGAGMPVYGRGGKESGDLLVNIDVEFPRLSDAQRQQLVEVLGGSGDTEYNKESSRRGEVLKGKGVVTLTPQQVARRLQAAERRNSQRAQEQERRQRQQQGAHHGGGDCKVQ
eukprot:Hpha_TRINITY_DN9005_c0_g1::TRINITY_DN9005_c0_g1_i2::g.141823::m.141823